MNARQSDPGDGRRSQFFKGLAEMAVLSLLHEQPRFGLEILAELRERAGLDLAEGTIYPLLHRLYRAGLLSAEWRVGSTSAPPRKYYALTDAGAVELRLLLADWRQLSGRLTAFLDREVPA